MSSGFLATIDALPDSCGFEMESENVSSTIGDRRALDHAIVSSQVPVWGDHMVVEGNENGCVSVNYGCQIDGKTGS